MSRVIVTGASGFIGREVCRYLVSEARPVRAIVRRPGKLNCTNGGLLEERVVADLKECVDDPAIFCGADAVVHLAARVHVEGPISSSTESIFQNENAKLTRALARTAASAGVKRFVFMSSVKALAERSDQRALRPEDRPMPEDAYGRSKLQAECELAMLSDKNCLEVAVIRSPLVYGPDVRANFRALVDVVARGIPMPLGGVCNRRSVLSVWNAADFIVRCLGPLPSQYALFHVADPTPVSTPQLIRMIADALSRPARLFSVPPVMVSTILRAIGRGAWVDRLMNSLELDTSSSFDALGWQPRLDVADGIRLAIRQMQI